MCNTYRIDKVVLGSQTITYQLERTACSEGFLAAKKEVSGSTLRSERFKLFLMFILNHHCVFTFGCVSCEVLTPGRVMI